MEKNKDIQIHKDTWLDKVSRWQGRKTTAWKLIKIRAVYGCLLSCVLEKNRLNTMLICRILVTLEWDNLQPLVGQPPAFIQVRELTPRRRVRMTLCVRWQRRAWRLLWDNLWLVCPEGSDQNGLCSFLLSICCWLLC